MHPEDMDDVTDLFLTYREAVRHLWKTYFAPRKDAELPWLFISIEYDLFYSLIVWELGRATDQAAVSGDVPFGRPDSDSHQGFTFEPFPYLHVIPFIAPLGTSVIWLNNNTDEGSSELGDLHSSLIDLRLIGFDDTSMDEFSDWRYYKARVVSYPQNPIKEGSDILIEVHNARIFFESSV